LSSHRERIFKQGFQTVDGGAIAEIFTRGSQPYRKIVTGRQRKPVGRPVMVKAGMRAIEWESIRAEKPFYELCEVATPVHSMFAQPHLLRMAIVGEAKRMDFIPDLQVTVDTAFAASVTRGVPFVDAVRAWKPKSQGSISTMIIEVKDDEDPRNHDQAYLNKLALAEQAYRAAGWFFLTVVKSEHISHPITDALVRKLFLKRKATISAADLTLVRDAFGAGQTLPWRTVLEALGDGPKALAKACSMHVRRLIAIDLSVPLTPSTMVTRVQDNRPIFELPGGLPW
jgi:hypothetical protein